MSDDIIIDVKNVWKRYGLPPLLPWKRRALHENDCALKDISFQVRRGGSLGILGRNGAGKSTLLKLLAGVTPPDKGSIDIRGSIFPMIELNAGISMELSGIENIHILAAIMGLNNREITDIIPAVEEFSELESWLYKPVWQYSSGMLARLAFSIAVNVKADILLVDEVLSVGDILFEKKCEQKIRALMQKGVTLLFVSHSPSQVERICQYGMILENKELVFFSDSNSAYREYMHRCGRKNTSKKIYNTELEDSTSRPGTGSIRLTHIELRNEAGEKIQQFVVGEKITVILAYESYEYIDNWNISLRIIDKHKNLISLITPNREVIPNTHPHSRSEITVTFNSMPLLGDGYSFTVMFASAVLIDLVEDACYFSVSHTQESSVQTANLGILYLHTQWTYKELQ
ncbi:ABC transporter ATP-binding protein [uncultured Desulfovibrio sp.]|uniref:ABC transporter ATP-binding protein n=1 Tax=uncultured Desulfovibrio sp. TaxID=167968 RepID=UPI00260A2510|nr:ABC transporter ATP-binding protein [uncultured Desulfovibrio sp.]